MRASVLVIRRPVRDALVCQRIPTSSGPRAGRSLRGITALSGGHGPVLDLHPRYASCCRWPMHGSTFLSLRIVRFVTLDLQGETPDDRFLSFASQVLR